MSLAKQRDRARRRIRQLKGMRTHEVALAKAGLGPVAGVDEAGRGACAGPITIAACILPDRFIPELELLDDSKKLTPARRAHLFPLIKRHAIAWHIVHISAHDIDERGITDANISGMRRAVGRLAVRPGYVLTDAWWVPGFAQPSLPVIGGDATARCIAAASVLAKYSRDQIMIDYDAQYPGYGFAGHKGYGTAKHMDAVRHHGASPIHRYSYSNVRNAHRDWMGAES